MTPQVKKASQTNSRVVIHILSHRLQEVYDSIILKMDHVIKAFYISANGPYGKQPMQVPLLSIPRPMLAASFSKVAGYETLSEVQCFNSYSAISKKSHENDSATLTSKNPPLNSVNYILSRTRGILLVHLANLTLLGPR
jgi:hypothetical protein